MALVFVKKSQLSKKRLRLQGKESSTTGLNETQDAIIRMWQTCGCRLVANLSEFGLPKQGEQLHLISVKTFNAIGIIDSILSKERIVEAMICVYSIDYDSGRVIDKMTREGQLGKVTLLISNLRNGAYRQKEAVVRDLFISNPNMTLIFCGLHAKIICLRTERNSYVVETSANFANNSRIESYVITNDATLYDFHRSWIDGIDRIATAKELAIYAAGQQVGGLNQKKIYNGTTSNK